MSIKKSVGDILKNERLKRNVSLYDLSRISRIKKEYLKALENNDFENLPSAVFVKGYIATYARILGFDKAPVLAVLRRDFIEDPTGKLLPKKRQNINKKRFFKPFTLASIFIFIVFSIVGGYLFWQWKLYSSPPKIEIYSPYENEVVSGKIVVSGKTLPYANLTINDDLVEVDSNGEFSKQIEVSHPGVFVIEIKVVDRKGRQTTIKRSVFVKF